jgi:hypothetical protein
MIGVGALRVLLSSGEASQPVDHTAPAAAVMATVELAVKAPSEALNCRTDEPGALKLASVTA